MSDVAIAGGHRGATFRAPGLTGNVDHLKEDQSTPVGVWIAQVVVDRFLTGDTFSCLQLPVKMTEPYEIAEYLSKHPEANDVLETTFAEVQRFFSNEDFRLEIDQNPAEEVDSKLALYIETRKDPEEALSCLDLFDQNFWLNHINVYDQYLSVHLEYH